MKGILWIRDWIIILGIALCIFFVLEGGLRILYPEKTGQEKRVAFENHDTYLVSLKPNISKTFIRSPQNGGDHITWTTNNLSFRGHNLETEVSMRVVVYGDSNVQARFSTLENTFTEKLERYLQRYLNKSDVEVLNGGVVGFGPDQSLLKFESEVDTIAPDLVIFHIFADNDFGDLIRNRLFELDEHGDLIDLRHSKNIDPLLNQEFTTDNFLGSLLVVKAGHKAITLMREKLFEGEVNSLIRQYLSYSESEYSVYRYSQARQFSNFFDHYDLDVSLFPQAKTSKVKIQLMEAVLRKAKGIARLKGVDMMVLIQPSNIDMTRNFTLSYDKLSSYEGYRPSGLSDLVESLCVKNEISFVNLFSIFSENNPDSLYFKGGNNHWNDKGQDLAAKETALYISRQPALSSVNEL